MAPSAGEPSQPAAGMAHEGEGRRADRLAEAAASDASPWQQEGGSFWKECGELDWSSHAVRGVLALQRAAHGSALEPWLRRCVGMCCTLPSFSLKLLPLAGLTSCELSSAAEALLFGPNTAGTLCELAESHAAVLFAVRSGLREPEVEGLPRPPVDAVVRTARAECTSPSRWHYDWTSVPSGRSSLTAELFRLFRSASDSRLLQRVASGLHVLLDEAVCEEAGGEVVGWLDWCLDACGVGSSHKKPWGQLVRQDGEWELPHPVACSTLLMAVLCCQLCRRGRSMLVTACDASEGTLGGLLVGLVSRFHAVSAALGEVEADLHRVMLEVCVSLVLGCATPEQARRDSALLAPLCPFVPGGDGVRTLLSWLLTPAR